MNKGKLSLIIIGLFLLTLFPQKTLAENEIYKFGTYNIRIETANDTGDKAWSNRKEAVANTIIANDIDVSAFQEIANQNQEDDLRSLLETAGYNLYTWGRESATINKGEKVGVTYKTAKFELLDKGFYFLTVDPTTPSASWDSNKVRLTVYVKLKSKTTGEIFFYFATHLDNVGDRARREGSMINAAKMLEISGDYPAFLGGDFNCINDNVGVHYSMRSYFEDARMVSETEPLGPFATYCGFVSPANLGDDKLTQFDHIFLKQARVLSYKAITDDFGRNIMPSDHVCLMISVQLTGDQRKHKIYVNPEVTSGDGSVTSPFKTLEEALNIAQSRDTILITASTISPQNSKGNSPRNSSFNITKSITLLGGYNSDFSNVTGKTCISGDYQQDDELDANGLPITGNDNNLYRLISVDAPYRLTLRNFKLTGAYADNQSGGLDVGGAICTLGASLYLSNVEVSGCYALTAGAGISSTGQVLIDSCSFVGNKTAGKGAALHLSSVWGTSIQRSLFKQNEAESGSAAYLEKYGDCYIASNTFTENTCKKYGTLSIWGITETTTNLVNNTFVNNTLTNDDQTFDNPIGGSAVYFNTPFATHLLGLASNTIIGNNSHIQNSTPTYASSVAAVSITAIRYILVNNVIAGNYTTNGVYHDLYASTPAYVDKYNVYSTATSVSSSPTNTDIYSTNYTSAVLNLSSSFEGTIQGSNFKPTLAENSGVTPTVKLINPSYGDQTLNNVSVSTFNEAGVKMDLDNNGKISGYYYFDQRGINRDKSGKASRGAYEYSESVGINTTIDDATSAYITEGILYVNTDDNYAYQVYDTQGKLFLSGESDKAEVSLRGLPKGIYIALIHIKKKTETFKFIL